MSEAISPPDPTALADRKNAKARGAIQFNLSDR